MPQTLVHFISTYGYWAIFWLVFLQEIGVPNPVSNELVLLFSGSLAFTGLLIFPLIFLTAVSADIIGATVLYTVFFFFGRRIMKRRSGWLLTLETYARRMEEPVKKHGMWGVFFGRLLPFARGYAAVAAGMLGITPTNFFIPVIASAVVWSGGFVILGDIFGKYWIPVANTVGGIEKILLGAILITVAILVLRKVIQKKKDKKSS